MGIAKRRTALLSAHIHRFYIQGLVQVPQNMNLNVVEGLTSGTTAEGLVSQAMVITEPLGRVYKGFIR